MTDRIPLDFYETPAWQSRALLRYAPIVGTVAESCAGAGGITSVLETHPRIARIVTSDLLAVFNTMVCGDARADMTWERLDGLTTCGIDWVIDNPPFSAAFEILPKAMANAKLGVAFLLRMSFLEPTDARGPWLKDHPPNLRITLPRTKYRKDKKGTDSVTTEWMVWYRDAQLPIRVGTVIVDKSERDELIAEAAA